MIAVYLEFLCCLVFFTRMKYWEHEIWINKTIRDSHVRRGFFGQLLPWYSLHPIPTVVTASLDWAWNDPECHWVAVSLCHQCSRAFLGVKELVKWKDKFQLFFTVNSIKIHFCHQSILVHNPLRGFPMCQMLKVLHRLFHVTHPSMVFWGGQYY